MKRNPLALLGLFGLILSGLHTSASAQDGGAPQDAASPREVAEQKALWEDLSGEWIRYENDMIITHKIENNREVSQVHSQYGDLWQGFTADVELGREDGNRIYMASNAMRTYPPDGGAVPPKFIANYIVRGDHVYFMRGIFDKTVGFPMLHEIRRATRPQDHLLIAARTGDFETVERLLDAGLEVDGVVPHSYTALAYAASFGHLEVVDLLLKHGAKVSARGRWSKTPLLHAAGSDQVEACKALVAAGANPEDVNWGGHNCVFEACYWGQPKTLDYFLSLGSDVNNTKPSGHTPLHHVVFQMRANGDPERQARLVECLQVLLKRGADTTLENRDGETAGAIAAKRGHAEVAKLLQ